MTKEIAKILYQISLKTKTNNLDKKHSRIVAGAKKIGYSDLIRDYRNWDMQSDSGIPFQINLYNFKAFGNLRYIRYLLSKLKTFIFYACDEVEYFFDDIEIIKLLNGFDILEKCPVHESPGNNLAYFINKNVSANVRWLRYIYFTSVIRNFFNDKKTPEYILDIGSYYGGFQYVMKHIFPKSSHILVDFPHQLARSSIFLNKAFPNSRILAIYDLDTLNDFFEFHKDTKYDFLLLTTDFFNSFSDQYSKLNKKIDLITNFYSLGEMPKNFFNSYLESKLIKESKYLYFCNRYDSSPFYEKTFQESFSMMDYLVEGFKVKLNRSSGIHNYMKPIRYLFKNKKPRPISAGYFEIIQKNKN